MSNQLSRKVAPIALRDTANARGPFERPEFAKTCVFVYPGVYNRTLTHVQVFSDPKRGF